MPSWTRTCLRCGALMPLFACGRVKYVILDVDKWFGLPMRVGGCVGR